MSWKTLKSTLVTRSTWPSNVTLIRCFLRTEMVWCEETTCPCSWSCLLGFPRHQSQSHHLVLMFVKENYVAQTAPWASAFCLSTHLGTNTGWRWSTRPPVTQQRTSSASLPQTLRSASAGATTASSGSTSWPARDTWICRPTRWCCGGCTRAHRHTHTHSAFIVYRHWLILSSIAFVFAATRFAPPHSSRSAEISTGTSASWSRLRAATSSRSTTWKRCPLALSLYKRFHICHLF